MELPALVTLFCVSLLRASGPLESDPMEVVFESAVRALSAGDYRAAEQGFLQVLQSSPNNAGALGNLGVVYSRTNQTGKAIEIYSRALKLYPQDASLHLNLGLAYFKRDDYAAALPHFAEVVAKDPGHAKARELLATCRIYTGAAEAAIVELELLRQGDPHNMGILYLLGVGYLKVKQPEKAKEVLNEMFSHAASTAQANFVLGRTYYDAGQFSEAEQFYRRALETDPHLPGAPLELAKVLLSERQNEQAMAQLKQILAVNPLDVDANYFLGGALVQDGRNKEGVPYLEKALQLSPEAWAIYFYLGKARFQMGRAAEAAKLLKRSGELNPAEASIFYQLARAEKSLGNETEALAALQRVKELRAQGLDREMKMGDVRAVPMGTRAEQK